MKGNGLIVLMRLLIVAWLYQRVFTTTVGNQKRWTQQKNTEEGKDCSWTYLKDRKPWPKEGDSNTMLNINYDIFHIEYAWIEAEERSIK